MMPGGGGGHPVRPPDPAPGYSDLLFVCHANQCRSPYLQAIARRLSVGTRLRMASGGLIAGGRPMPEAGQRVGQQLGFDFGGHRSRQVDLGEFGGFDLILTAARDQARELVAADPDARPRIFTVKQFSRWVTAHPRPRRAALGSWLDAAADGRPGDELLGHSPHDDIADPLRKGAPAWRAMVNDVTPHLQIVVDALR